VIGHRRRFSRRNLSANGANIALGLVIAAIIAVALTKGIQDHKLTLGTVVFILVLIPSIMFHEVSHGIVALWCGDDTAKRAGRISANPVRHIDPLGTIIVPAAMVLLLHGPGFFGWARPVPVALNKLRRPRNQAVLVGLAGPLSNGLLALVAGVALHFIMAALSPAAPSVLGFSPRANLYYSVLTFQTTNGGALYWVGFVIGMIGLANLLVGAFNLLPIPPLDGAALVERFIPINALPAYYRIRMGFIVVIVLLVWLDRGFLGTMFGDISQWYMNVISPALY
jgi:Zn-dependent protease